MNLLSPFVTIRGIRGQFFYFILLALFVVRAAAQQPPVLPGVEVLVAHHAAELRGLRLGILTNPTGVDRAFTSTIDLVRRLPGVTVVRLFSPEHGLRGGHAAGEAVADSRDPVSGLPVVSLYGANRRPSAASLAGLDAVLYDIQDVGHRTYTFVSTLTYLMEACEAAGVAVWVLDRPDPLGGDKVGGPMLEEARRSFIGVHEVPQVYGLTPGEWARLIQAERTPRLKLKVVPMQGWRRGMTYGDLGWAWVPPSPNIPRWESAFFYAMTGTLGELGMVSEGVGTALPFEQVGAPWIDAEALARALGAAELPGMRFRATDFTPRFGLFTGQACRGVQIHLEDPRACDPARISQALMTTLARLYPGRGLFAPRKSEAYDMFVKALGSGAVARALAAGESPAALEAAGKTGYEQYLERRRKILIYP